MGKSCVICGAPSGMYPLCRLHLKMKNEGLVAKCEHCGKWYLVADGCDCQKAEKKLSSDFDEEDVEQPLRNQCLTCGEDANGFWFCRDCYRKYHNKTLVLKVTNCTEVETLSDVYSGSYICPDGHVVKSKAEREIDNYLFNNRIPHAYEKSFPIDGNKAHDLHPDFYLPNEDVYIEYWGFDDSNEEYASRKKYKMDIYRQRKITLINLYEKSDSEDIDRALTWKLSNYVKGEINFEESDVEGDSKKNIFRGKR